MNIILSKRVSNIQSSPTLAITAYAAKLKKAGKSIIDLSSGEPDFDTPEHIKEAACEALRKGFTKYTPIGGTPDLKQAIIDKFNKENKLTYSPDNILVSCGAKHSLYNLMQALLNPGDEVIIPAPYWVSYPDMVKLSEGVPVILNTDITAGYKLDPDKLAAAITPRTRLLILNSPCNPTGNCYRDEDLASLANVLLQYPEVMVATDDIYEHILWGQDQFHNIINICPELMPRTIIINGVSKAYSMTGWRIGYTAAPQTIISAMAKIQSQSTSNPTSISQYATQIALQGDQSYIKKSRAIFKARHDFVIQNLHDIPDVAYQPSDGTFYCFPNLSAVISRIDQIQNDIQLTKLLLEEAGVATVPGSAFGMPGAIRISFATDMETLGQGMERIKKTLS